jgi:hypothetical protein
MHCNQLKKKLSLLKKVAYIAKVWVRCQEAKEKEEAKAK